MSEAVCVTNFINQSLSFKAYETELLNPNF